MYFGSALLYELGRYAVFGSSGWQIEKNMDKKSAKTS